MKRYRHTFDFFDTEEQARKFCEAFNKRNTAYIRKKHPAHYAPWTSQDGKAHKYVAFYVY